jgi:hypothetical protein
MSDGEKREPSIDVLSLKPGDVVVIKYAEGSQHLRVCSQEMAKHMVDKLRFADKDNLVVVHGSDVEMSVAQGDGIFVLKYPAENMEVFAHADEAAKHLRAQGKTVMVLPDNIAVEVREEESEPVPNAIQLMAKHVGPAFHPLWLGRDEIIACSLGTLSVNGNVSLSIVDGVYCADHVRGGEPCGRALDAGIHGDAVRVKLLREFPVASDYAHRQRTMHVVMDEATGVPGSIWEETLKMWQDNPTPYSKVIHAPTEPSATHDDLPQPDHVIKETP